MAKFPFRLFFSFLIIILIPCSQAFSGTGTEAPWDGLLKREPYIYTVPRVDKETAADGVWVKKALREGDIVPCRRCPDWLADPGIWRLFLDKGVYRIINTHTGWKSIGTYIVSGDRIFMANDPACIYEFGLYSFKIEDGRLKFTVIDDPCAIQLRGKNLAETEWISCIPPNREAATSTHWLKPEGCR